ncbi:protein giant [Cotesia glomerata]|nr:protein giant [Cotesia glomerata]
MTAYVNSPSRHLALDCTSLKQNFNEKTETVLDLSCKKEHDSQIASCNLSPVSLEARSVSPLSESTNEQHHYHHHNNNYHEELAQQHQAQKQQNCPRYYQDYHNNSSEDEQKSPESRSFMVTPPSDSDSPTKSKYQGISPQQTSPETDHHHHYSPTSSPMLFMNNPITHPVHHPVMPVPNNSISYPQVLAPTTNLLTINPKVSEQACTPDVGKKAPRPFKAYPKDPLALTVSPPEFMYDQNSKESYSEFRKRMLESVRKSNDGTNIKMRRLSKNSNLPTSTVDDKDMAYWERRRKNNEAAKRSRDARRAKEDEIAIRAAYLEQENIKLKYEIIALRNETARLRCMIYPS